MYRWHHNVLHIWAGCSMLDFYYIRLYCMCSSRTNYIEVSWTIDSTEYLWLNKHNRYTGRGMLWCNQQQAVICNFHNEVDQLQLYVQWLHMHTSYSKCWEEVFIIAKTVNLFALTCNLVAMSENTTAVLAKHLNV